MYDRARTPHRSPRSTPCEVVSKMLYLRQHYHFGPSRIADYLRRFHGLSVAPSSVHRILGRHGMSRLPANQKHRPHAKRWKRYEKAQPGLRLQVDVKFLERIPGTGKRLYQFTAIDDCTRLRILKVYDACNQNTATRFIDAVLRRLPFRVHVIQTDNGAEFQSRFHWHVEALDVRHLYPPTNASPERQGRTVTSRRRPGVLSAAGPGRRRRRHPSLQHEASRMGGLLQLPPSARCSRWTNTLRTAPRQNKRLACHQRLGTVQIALPERRVNTSYRRHG